MENKNWGDKVLKHFIDNEITIPREQVERIAEVLI